MREFLNHAVLSMSDSTMAILSKYTQDLSVQIVFFTFSCKWFLCFYSWAVIWSSIVDLFAGLHVRAHCHCASLVRTLYMTWRVPRHARHVFRARAPSRTQQNIELMTFAVTWSANIFVGCSVTPTFFSADHFLFRFFPLSPPPLDVVTYISPFDVFNGHIKVLFPTMMLTCNVM